MKSLRLSNNIFPEHYDLFIKPNLIKNTFNGKVIIFLEIKKPTNKIILHSSELKIKKQLIKKNNKLESPKLQEDKKTETIILSLAKKISGKISLEIEFEGILNDQLYGFYISKYEYQGKTKYLATTQFEAPYARKAFPCFDEPSKKATFSLTLEIPSNLKAISNMPSISIKNSKETNLIKFQKTPKMSTYLLYFAVGEFEFLQTKYKDKIIRVATTPGKAKQGKLALDLTKKFLAYFESYSKIKYPLPKLDLIAIPDFNAGAMENWGAITFREVILLYDKKHTSLQIKKRIAEVIAHELWHQWSGNLVTMEWWDDLWLNESFATYMAYKAVDYYFPEWNMWEDFVSDQTEGAFSQDKLKTTHPIAVKVNSPNEIEEIFDEISYGKGGSILRMIESYLGSKIFQKGVSNYLKKHNYKNAKASDLWNELSKVSNLPIKDVMESWITQPGYPYLKIEKEKNYLKLTQQRFNITTNQIWKIPLTIKTNSKIIKTLLTKKAENLKLPADTKWYKINIEQKGFYRVLYPNEDLIKLKNLIETNQLSLLDKNSIQKDLFSFTFINQSPLNTYLEFIKAYNNEKSEFILSDIFGSIYFIYLIFSKEPFWSKIWPRFKAHIKTPFQNNFEELGWEPKQKESPNDSLLRSLTLSYLSFCEHKEIIKEGEKRFLSHIRKKRKIHPDIKGAIFSLIARHGNKKAYNRLINAYFSTLNLEEKIKLLAALYKFNDKKLIKKALNFALTKNVRSQDLRTVFAVTNSNPTAKEILFSWVKKNWNKLKRFEKAHFVFISLLEALITSYTGKVKELEIKKFLKNKNVKYEKTKSNAFETMQINTHWLENNRSILEDYFS